MKLDEYGLFAIVKDDEEEFYEGGEYWNGKDFSEELLDAKVFTRKEEALDELNRITALLHVKLKIVKETIDEV